MIFRSPHADVEIPDVPLARFVLRRADELSDKPALIDGPTGRTLTYGQLRDQARALAAGLASRSFGTGDVFAILLPNLPEYAVAFHGVAMAGGVCTTVNPLSTVDELTAQLADSGAVYLLTIPQFLPTAREASSRAGVKEVFVLGEADGAAPFGSLLEPGGRDPDVAIDPAEDLAALPYSSGTTGISKGVMLTHRNLVANLCQAEIVQPIGQDEVVIGVLPFFHIYGQTVIMNLGLARGATIVTMPRFELEPFLRTLEERRVTRAYVVPPIVLALAKHPAVQDHDLSSLRVVFCGAAPLGADLATACESRIGCRVAQGYGLTESSPVTNAAPEGPAANRPGSIGPPIPNTECRVLDYTTGADLGPGVDGEILVRGPQVMKGYLNNPSATADTVDADGWLHTGDIGHADEDGYFYVVDRLKELIKYRGFQVPPAELEAILVTHPAVGDAAVIPSPDEEAGEIPKAFVVLKGDATPGEIMDFVNERVSPGKKIRRIEFVDEIPKSPSGKILRRVLVERERRAAEAPSG